MMKFAFVTLLALVAVASAASTSPTMCSTCNVGTALSTLQSVDLSDPAAALALVGGLTDPLLTGCFGLIDQCNFTPDINCLIANLANPMVCFCPGGLGFSSSWNIDSGCSGTQSIGSVNGIADLSALSALGITFPNLGLDVVFDSLDVVLDVTSNFPFGNVEVLKDSIFSIAAGAHPEIQDLIVNLPNLADKFILDAQDSVTSLVTALTVEIQAGTLTVQAALDIVNNLQIDGKLAVEQVLMILNNANSILGTGSIDINADGDVQISFPNGDSIDIDVDVNMQGGSISITGSIAGRTINFNKQVTVPDLAAVASTINMAIADIKDAIDIQGALQLIQTELIAGAGFNLGATGSIDIDANSIVTIIDNFVSGGLAGALSGSGSFNIAIPSSNKRQESPFSFDFDLDLSAFAGIFGLENVQTIIDEAIAALDAQLNISADAILEFAANVQVNSVEVAADGTVIFKAPLIADLFQAAADSTITFDFEAARAEVLATINGAIDITDALLQIDICNQPSFASFALNTDVVLMDGTSVTGDFSGCVVVDCTGVSTTETCSTSTNSDGDVLMQRTTTGNAVTTGEDTSSTSATTGDATSSDNTAGDSLEGSATAAVASLSLVALALALF